MSKKKVGTQEANGNPKTQQVNQYDKVLRENMEPALPGLIERLLKIQVDYSEELPDDVQHTKERKPDVLKKVTDKKGETFILHVEFQVKDEKEMAFRMVEYYYMLLRLYKIPVRQYVIYIGEGRPTMPDHLRTKQAYFKYQLIPLSLVNYHLFLHSDRLEEKMLAILADFKGDDPEEVIKILVSQIVKSEMGDLEKGKYLQQLRILAQLRNFIKENLSVMDSIANYISEENDILYLRGELKGIEKGMEKGIEKGVEKGEEKRSREVVKNLLALGKFTIAEIANLANVTDIFVNEVKASLK